MKKLQLIISTLLIAASTFLHAQEKKETVDLSIEITIKKHQKGFLFLSLFNDEEKFMHQAYKSKKVVIQDKKVTITFKNIEKGEYAFSMFHDVNGNSKLDKNFIGIPKEPYAFSNNQKGRFGPPSFNNAKIKIDQNKTVTVKIN